MKNQLQHGNVGLKGFILVCDTISRIMINQGGLPE